MQQELIEMLEKVVDHVVFCNGYDQRFSSTSYGVKILEEAGELVEKAKNGAKEPAVPHGWKSVLIPTEWTIGPNMFKDWCNQWFGPDADDEYLMRAAHALLGLAATPAAPSQERCCTCGYLTSEREHLGCLRKAVKDLDAATGGPYPSQEPVSERFVWMNNRWWKLHPKATVDADQINGLSVDPGETLMTLVEGQSGDSLKINTKGGQTVVAMVGQHHIEVSAPHKVSDGLFAALINTLTAQCGKPPTVFRSAQEPVTLADDDIARCINVATCGRPFIGLMNPGGVPSAFSRSLADLLIAALREKQGGV